MTEARICDNCGKVEEGNQAHTSMFAGLKGERDSTQFHFCQECTEVLISSIETSDEITEPGEWNFTKEGSWNQVEDKTKGENQQ